MKSMTVPAMSHSPTSVSRAHSTDAAVDSDVEQQQQQQPGALGPAQSIPAAKRRKFSHNSKSDESDAHPGPSSQDASNPGSSSPSSSSVAPAGPATQVMLLARPVPLMVCSIGNPGAHYADTLHSAGHTLMNHLADRLGYASFHKEKALGNGLVSYPTPSSEAGGEWTLWQSPSYMNESGKSVRAAYMAWSQNLADGEGKLVIIHDQLEKPLGTVSLRTAQGASAKGHNGLKSIMSLMGQVNFARIGIGIGRPASRQSDDVARYVLKKMDPAEHAAIEGAVDQVIAKLKELERG